MSRILYVGGKLNSVVTSGSGIIDNTTAGRFNSTYCDSCLNISTSGTTATATLVDESMTPTPVTTGQTLYAHMDFIPVSDTTTTNPIWIFKDSGGSSQWLSVRGTNTLSTYQLYYNSGTGGSPTWTAVGSSFVLPAARLFTLDLKVVLGSPHAFEFSVGGTLSTWGTFTQASMTNLAYMTVNAPLSQNFAFSQLLATEGISTIGAFVKYTSATGSGNSSGWTGAASDINEAVNNDSTTLSAASASLKSTLAWGDVTVPVGSVIKGAFIWYRAKNDGSAPANIKAVVRSSGTDYLSASNLTGMGTSFAPVGYRADNDPATSALWTQTAWNAVEIGVESET